MNNKCFRSNFNFKGKKMERYFRCVHNLKHGVNAILYKVKDPILPSVCIYIYIDLKLCVSYLPFISDITQPTCYCE